MIGDPIAIWRLFYGAFIPDWLVVRQELSPGAKLCYGQLAAFAGVKDHCWPRLQLLANTVGIGERQTRRYVSELLEHALIKVEYRKEKGQSSIYVFLEHEWMPPPEERRQEETTGHKRPEGSGHKRPEGMTHVSGGADISVRTRKRLKEVDSSKRPIGLSPSAPKEILDPVVSVSSSGMKYAPPPTSAQPSPSPSLEGLRAAEQDAIARSESVQEAQAARRVRAGARMRENGQQAQCEANLRQGKTYPPGTRKALKDCELLWLEGMRTRWPGTQFSEWGKKERGQCAELLGRYSGAVVEQALRYVVDEWGAINTRFFKGKGSFPGLGTLLKFHDILVPEAQRWNELVEVRREYDRWFIDHPNDMVPPADLKDRYEAARKDMEALGL